MSAHVNSKLSGSGRGLVAVCAEAMQGTTLNKKMIRIAARIPKILPELAARSQQISRNLKLFSYWPAFRPGRFSVSAVARGTMFVACDATISHSPPRFISTRVKITRLGAIGLPSGFRSP